MNIESPETETKIAELKARLQGLVERATKCGEEREAIVDDTNQLLSEAKAAGIDVYEEDLETYSIRSSIGAVGAGAEGDYELWLPSSICW